jgi:acetyl esterase/lipase
MPANGIQVAMILPEVRPSTPRRFRSRLRWRRLLWLVGTAFAVWLLWFWPARRNYYFKSEHVRRRLDVPYAADPFDPKRQLDLYLPEGAAAGFPIVVFVHGGYWSALDRRWLQPLLGAHGNVGVAFARRGIGAAIIGYRQYPTIQHGDDSLDDIATAIRFVHASCPSWGCGPLFVVGHSAGGHLVSLLALDDRILRRNGVDSNSVNGFVSIDGIFDLAASLPAFTPDQVAIMRRLFGPDDASLALHSTIAYARQQHPRLLFVDSTGDEKVCRDAFRQMKTRMAEAGSPAEFVELSGLGHNETIIRVGMDDDPVMPSLLAFIHRQQIDRRATESR